ncbi:unnamed protein product [Blepharisma stoltei]|uniref:CCDC81 HU domain-containing protein n=1 Tax=Blepharisma stoltei TaxID=1481888 RepID=A0AAU9J7A1_9CILI|nr:unnamed protein product [Blepharisma stoltei]
MDNLIAYILSNPGRYPGSHLYPQPRSNQSVKPLEPASQMQLIWKATVEYIHEKILEGKGVNIKGFGAFTFDIETKLAPVTAINPTSGEIDDQRLDRKHLHKNRPVFIPDPSLQSVLLRYHGKNQVEKPASQRSVFQRGFQMIFCNPVPIAQACYIDKNVVVDTHRAIFSAIKELATAGRSITIPFNFAVIIISNLTLETRFNQNFAQNTNSKYYEAKMRKSDVPCATFWQTTSQDKWRSSALSSLWSKPDRREVQTMNEKTLALKIMSLDLASSVRPKTTL